MTTTRSAVLLLAILVTACASDEEPSQSVVRAAAAAARQAALEDPASTRIVSMRPTKPCAVTIANGEPHSALAQMVLQEASLAIQTSEGLSIAGSRDSDLKLLLFRTKPADPRSHAWKVPPSPDRAAGDFYIAYVILAQDQHYLVGDLIECKGKYKECGERMALRTLRVCQSREA